MSGIDLGDLAEDFAAASPMDAKQSIPDGKYQVMLDSCYLEKNDKDNRFLVWEFVILSGPHINRKIFKRHYFQPTEISMRILKTDLLKAGLVLDDITELQKNLHTIIDGQFEVVLKTKGEYQNCYINRKMRPVSEYTPPRGDVEDVPF